MLSVQWCNKPVPKLSTAALAFNIVFLVLVAVVLFATGVHVFGRFCGKLQGKLHVTLLWHTPLYTCVWHKMLKSVKISCLSDVLRPTS